MLNSIPPDLAWGRINERNGNSRDHSSSYDVNPRPAWIVWRGDEVCRIYDHGGLQKTDGLYYRSEGSGNQGEGRPAYSGHEGIGESSGEGGEDVGEGEGISIHHIHNEIDTKGVRGTVRGLLAKVADKFVDTEWLIKMKETELLATSSAQHVEKLNRLEQAYLRRGLGMEDPK